MALPMRLLGRLGGGGRRRLPPALAVLPHLAASASSPSHRSSPPASRLPLPPCALPFAIPARSFSWYSRSPSAPAAAPAADAPDEEVHAEGEGDYLGDASSADYAEVIASAAGASADDVGVAAAVGGGDGGSVPGLAVSSLVDLLDGFHDVTGLPWWVTISCSTVAMRLLIFPVLVVQLKKSAVIGQLFPKLPPPFPPPLSGRSFRDQFSLFRKRRRELGCPSFLWNWAYLSVQFPCFILWMSTIRTMCLSNHPGLDNGGILWFHNLTEFSHGAIGPVFPILVAGLHYLNVQISFQKTNTKTYPGIFGILAKYYKIYLDILTVPLFLIAYVVPQGSLVYWTTNGLFTVAQQLSLRNDVVSRMLGLPDTRARLGNTSQKSPLDGHKMIQQLPLGDARMQTNLTSSDSGTTSENTTPNFMLESSSVMEGNVSESSSPEELLEQALQHLGSGHRGQAVPLIRTAIEKNPDLSTALIGMGQTLFASKLFPEATVCFEHAIPKIGEQDPLLVLSYYCAGISRIQQDDNKVAIELLQRLAELKEPEKDINKQCYYRGVVLLGSVLSTEGQKSEAAKFLRRAVAYDPSVERLLKECEDATEDQPKSAEH